MRLKQLFIWITFTALLQWSAAQEEEDIPLITSGEDMEMATSEVPLIEKETDQELHQTTTESTVEATQPAMAQEEQPVEMATNSPEIHLPAEAIPLNTVTTEKQVDNEPESIDYQNEEAVKEVTVPPTQPPTTLKIPTLPPMPKIPPPPPLPNYCFSCTSPLNGTCQRNPTKRLQCPLTPGIRNGCFTIVKRDAKLIMRGCLTELSEEDKTFCVSDNKFCQLCYEMTCNKEEAFDATAGAGLVIWPSTLLAVIFSLISSLI